MREVAPTTRTQRVRSRDLYRWLLSYGSPYRSSLLIFVGLMVLEILVGLLVPWPMKVLVDNVLGEATLPAWLVGLINSFSLGGGKVALLIAVCVAGLLFWVFSGVVALRRQPLQL